jgi:hypothetical protein
MLATVVTLLILIVWGADAALHWSLSGDEEETREPFERWRGDD